MRQWAWLNCLVSQMLLRCNIIIIDPSNVLCSVYGPRPIVLSGWTSLRRNSTNGLQWPRVPHSLWAFAPLLFSRQRLLFLCLVPHSLTFFNSPYFRFVPHLPSQNPVEHARSRSLLVLSFTSLYPFPPAFPYPVLPTCVPHFHSQNPVELRVPSPAYFLSLPSRTSLYCVCNAFIFPFVLLGFSW